jgi:hypothetical protein
MANTEPNQQKLTLRNLRDVTQAFSDISINSLVIQAIRQSRKLQIVGAVAVVLWFGVVALGALVLNPLTNNGWGIVGGLTILFVFLLSIALIRQHHQGTLTALGDQSKFPWVTPRGWLEVLQFKLFSDEVPAHLRDPATHQKLLYYLRLDLEESNSVLSGHPFVLALVAGIVSVLGGLASRDGILMEYWFATIVFAVFALFYIWIVPDLIVSKRKRDQKFLRFVEWLDLEENSMTQASTGQPSQSPS